MLRLSEEQMAGLGADGRERYEARLAEEMRQAHPEVDQADVSARVADRVRAAVAAGVTDEATVTRHVRTTFQFDPAPAPPPPPPQASRAREQRRDPLGQSSRAVGSAVQSCLDWVNVELVDDDGTPVPGEPFVVELPDGTTRSGLTDGAGCAYLVGIPNGTCKITFPQTRVSKG
jgi:hypothetical protein